MFPQVHFHFSEECEKEKNNYYYGSPDFDTDFNGLTRIHTDTHNVRTDFKVFDYVSAEGSV
jgi:hypothetical protein